MDFFSDSLSKRWTAFGFNKSCAESLSGIDFKQVLFNDDPKLKGLLLLCAANMSAADMVPVIHVDNGSARKQFVTPIMFFKLLNSAAQATLLYSLLSNKSEVNLYHLIDGKGKSHIVLIPTARANTGLLYWNEYGSGLGEILLSTPLADAITRIY